MLFSDLLQCVIVTCNKIGFKSCVFQSTALFLRFFALINKKIMINNVMTNKMVWNDCTSPFKHVHIIR